MSQKLPNTEDGFNSFVNIATDLKVKSAPRKLEEELFKKNWAEKAIDFHEKSLGIPTVSTNKVEKRVYKHKLFKLEYDKDQALLTELMNSPKYNIIRWEANWTVDGEYRIFTIYSDNIDFKPEEEKK
jgi:hypothetical protein